MGENNLRFQAAVLVVSDRAFAGTKPDLSGPALAERLRELGYPIAFSKVTADDKVEIVKLLRDWIVLKIPLILTTGGTGLGPRDITPEATLDLIERRVPGMEEAMRRYSQTVTPHAMLSRAVVGVAGKSLIINLPGSPQGALENLRVIEPALIHALELIAGERPDP